MKLPIVFLVLAISEVSYAAEPTARLSIDKAIAPVPGQQVSVELEVLVPNFFTSPPQFPLFEMQDTMVTLPEERAQNTVETVAGIQYSGIRRTYLVIPEKPGVFTVPALRIPLGWSDDGVARKTEVVSPSASFEVGGTRSELPVFVARRLTIEQAFDRDPLSMAVGEALVRKIIVTAEDTQALTMPPVAMGSAKGFRQYVLSPKIEDGVRLGRTTVSRRTETVTYSSVDAGSFVLPAIAYPWFDAEQRMPATAVVAEVRIMVASAHARDGIAPDLRQQTDPVRDRRTLFFWAAAAAVLLAVFYLARDVPRKAKDAIRRIRSRRLASRSHELRRLRRIIQTAEPLAIYSALQEWSRGLGYRTLSDWASGHPDVGPQIAILERSLFGQATNPGIDRKTWRMLVSHTDLPRRKTPRSALPPLNP